jgi:hypothetical protein
MKDWKACIRTWENNNKSINSNKPKYKGYEERTYTKEETDKLFDNLDNIEI